MQRTGPQRITQKAKPVQRCSPIPQRNPSKHILQNNYKSLDNYNTPDVILAGNFNLPSLDWLDGLGHIHPSPLYGIELNSLFLDIYIINDYGLEQFIILPTREQNILDLVFSSQPIISNVYVPGISDHEAIIFCIDTKTNFSNKRSEHKVFLYHKCNIEEIKNDVLHFQNVFLSSNPYSKSVNSN